MMLSARSTTCHFHSLVNRVKWDTGGRYRVYKARDNCSWHRSLTCGESLAPRRTVKYLLLLGDTTFLCFPVGLKIPSPPPPPHTHTYTLPPPPPPPLFFFSFFVCFRLSFFRSLFLSFSHCFAIYFLHLFVCLFFLLFSSLFLSLCSCFLFYSLVSHFLPLSFLPSLFILKKKILFFFNRWSSFSAFFFFFLFV